MEVGNGDKVVARETCGGYLLRHAMESQRRLYVRSRATLWNNVSGEVFKAAA